MSAEHVHCTEFHLPEISHIIFGGGGVVLPTREHYEIIRVTKEKERWTKYGSYLKDSKSSST